MLAHMISRRTLSQNYRYVIGEFACKFCECVFQLQGLRDALDQVTMEKSSILSQLTLQRDEMTSLTNQLAEQQERMVAMTTAKDQMSTELYSCQQSLVSDANPELCYSLVIFWLCVELITGLGLE